MFKTSALSYAYFLPTPSLPLSPLYIVKWWGGAKIHLVDKLWHCPWTVLFCCNSYLERSYWDTSWLFGENVFKLFQDTPHVIGLLWSQIRINVDILIGLLLTSIKQI